MNEKLIKALLELGIYMVDFHKGALISTMFMSDESKEIILEMLSDEKRDEVLENFNKK